MSVLRPRSTFATVFCRLLSTTVLLAGVQLVTSKAAIASVQTTAPDVVALSATLKHGLPAATGLSIGTAKQASPVYRIAGKYKPPDNGGPGRTGGSGTR